MRWKKNETLQYKKKILVAYKFSFLVFENKMLMESYCKAINGICLSYCKLKGKTIIFCWNKIKNIIKNFEVFFRDGQRIFI
jgi:hypothetical protein